MHDPFIQIEDSEDTWQVMKQSKYHVQTAGIYYRHIYNHMQLKILNSQLNISANNKNGMFPWFSFLFCIARDRFSRKRGLFFSKSILINSIEVCVWESMDILWSLLVWIAMSVVTEFTLFSKVSSIGGIGVDVCEVFGRDHYSISDAYIVQPFSQIAWVFLS